MLQAGKLDRQIVIQSLTTGQSVYGGTTESYSTLATVFAKVTPLRGREFFDSKAINSEVDTRFVIRYRNDVTTKHRISYDSKIYDIHSVQEMGRRAGTEIMASASVD